MEYNKSHLILTKLKRDEVVMFYLHLTFLLVARSRVFSEQRIHVLYTEIKPFIFKNERGELDGIIPKQINAILKRCIPKNEICNVTFVSEFSVTELNSILFEKNKTIEDIFPKVNQSECTASVRDLDKLNLFVCPYFPGYKKIMNQNSIFRNPADVTLVQTNQIAKIMRREHINVTNKLLHGLKYNFFLILTQAIFIASVAIMLSFCDNYHNFLNGIPWSQFLSYFWFLVVTCTTVGYGDMVPITRLGKIITIIWMMVCIALVCSFTATVSSQVLGETEISLANKRIAVLQRSSEADIASKIYPNSDIIVEESYEKVIDRVIDKDAIAGFLNADYAAWIQDELREKHVHVVQLLDYDVSVNGIMEHNKFSTLIYRCMTKKQRHFMEPPVLFFQKDCKIENPYHDRYLSFLGGNWYLSLAAGLVILAIVIGIACDFIRNRRARRSSKNQLQNNLNLDGTESTIFESTINLHQYILSACADVKNVKDKL